MLCLWQGDCYKEYMSKRQKKKALVVKGEPEVEIITKVEYIYEDTKATIGVELDYFECSQIKWWAFYQGCVFSCKGCTKRISFALSFSFMH